MLGFTGVILREVDAGVLGGGDVGGFLVVDAVDAMAALPGSTHSISSTVSPDRHRASSASKRVMYF